MAGGHEAVVLVVDVHGRRVIEGHGCRSAISSMRRATSIWRIRHVGTSGPLSVSVMPLISRAYTCDCLGLRDDDGEQQEREQQRQSRRECQERQSLLCLLSIPLGIRHGFLR
jgi:hypothetical protein